MRISFFVQLCCENKLGPIYSRTRQTFHVIISHIQMTKFTFISLKQKIASCMTDRPSFCSKRIFHCPPIYLRMLDQAEVITSVMAEIGTKVPLCVDRNE